MVPGQKDRRHLFPSPLLRPAVLGIFQQIVVKGIKLSRFLVVQHTFQKPGHCIHNHQSRQLSAGQHIIADGHFIGYDLLQHPLVDSFIMSAQKDQFFLLRQFFCHFLVENLSLRTHIQDSMLPRKPGSNRLIRQTDRLRLHDHAGASPIRIIIHPIVFVH